MPKKTNDLNREWHSPRHRRPEDLVDADRPDVTGIDHRELRRRIVR
jgi:hypothetical protein